MANGRIEAVHGAVAKAISMLKDGTWFFVVAFDGNAYVIVRETQASPESKRWAAAQVAQVQAAGGTAMSTGLRAARAIFERAPNAIHQAVFLTDGKNEGEKPPAVLEELQRCEGVFECDCWGVGTDWQPRHLQTIARKLLGTATMIPNLSNIGPDFVQAVRTARERDTRNVRLRVWMPKAAQLVALKQVNPEILDLTDRAIAVDGQTWDFATGAWSQESRDYHLAVHVPTGTAGDEMLAARVTLVYDQGGQDVKYKGGDIMAAWTEDESLSMRMNEHVAFYTGQNELATAIQHGLEMRDKGQLEVATKLLGKAVKIAHQSGNEETMRRLKKVVDVVDPGHGTVKLKRYIAKEDAMDLDLGSTRTARTKRAVSS